MSRTARTTVHQARVLTLVLGLLLAQLFWQTLGQMHRVAHAAGPVAVLQPAAATTDAKPPDPAQSHWVTALFASHGDEGSCRVFDQLGQCDALASPAPAVLPQVLLALAVLHSLGEFLARRAALFQARAPPFVR